MEKQILFLLLLSSCARMERKSKDCEKGNQSACISLANRCHEGNMEACQLSATYERSARAEYIGNDTFEIMASGNRGTGQDLIRGYAYRKAFESCAAKQKGFEIVSSEDTTDSGVHSKLRFGGGVNINEYRAPGVRLQIKCKGAVDKALAEKYR